MLVQHTLTTGIDSCLKTLAGMGRQNLYCECSCATCSFLIWIFSQWQLNCARIDSSFLQPGRITFSSFLSCDSSQRCCNHLLHSCWIREAILVCPVVSWKSSHNSAGVLERVTHPSCGPGWKRAVTWANNSQVDTQAAPQKLAAPQMAKASCTVTLHQNTTGL